MALPAVTPGPVARVGPVVSVVAMDSMLLVVVRVVTVGVRGLPVRARPVWLGRHRCVMVVPAVRAVTVVTPVVPAAVVSAVLRLVGRPAPRAVRVGPTVAVVVVLVVLVAPGLTLRG